MPWARLDDGYFTHRKVLDLSCYAKLLDLAAIAYSARELTDGELRKRDVLVIAAQVDVDEAMAVVAELVESGRWERTGGNTWRIHDYLKYNPSREQILREREQTAKRQARFRAKGKRSVPRARKRNAVTTGALTAAPVSKPGPGIETPDPVPLPISKLDDAARDSFEFHNERGHHANGAVQASTEASFNGDLAFRIQQIGESFGDGNVASSITRAQRYQAAKHVDDGTMALAIKDAQRRTNRRANDASRAPPSNLMAYFLAVLEETTEERAATLA